MQRNRNYRKVNGMRKYNITQDEIITLVWIILFLIAVSIVIFVD